ncbi:hypothetical protein [Burkholderia lata]|uniref:Uncharacterized protein n=1 Tax=Burkholderia lata (strain ATCC 17760 / DSM 23089 / LMG 22485 / NCIMB 9086 / R18194 / 383) TaxID=482957 RepID=A0A6P2IWP2_BURL3|nr:hypothetical protein [Burkholderia lata]VWB34446.1 hypothetical protein BLA15945_01532 [Burkholderia lata]
MNDNYFLFFKIIEFGGNLKSSGWQRIFWAVRRLAFMGDRRMFAFSISMALFFLFSVPLSRAADVPVAIQVAIKARMDESHKLQPPIIDAGSVMQGGYIYFVINTSNVPGYTKDDKPYMLDAHLLFADESHIWHDVLFDRYVKDDGVPEISAVFFVNADHDKNNKEVVVLVRTPLNHYDYGGNYYDGYVYKVTGDPRTGVVFVGLQSDASAPFLDQCECDFRDGRSTHARYKDSESIRKELEKKYSASPPRSK